MANYINVTSLNRLAKRVLEQCDPLNDLIVCGEISGFTRHYKSGHLYFTLKDENASIKTVMFRSQAQLLNFEPQNGMLVLVYGRATIYERDGVFQLYADYMKPFGAGAAQMAFDALYKKLEAEGLFAPERKRPLPAVPRCIGVVTSKTGAAWQDVQNVIGRRWPMVKLLLAPVSVQGIEAEKTIETIMAADVNAELERMRERNSRMTNVERAAKNGDTALINFEGFKDGVAFEGGKGENFPLVLGSGQFIPGFEEQVVGHSAGEEFEVNVTFPEDYHAEDLKGQPVVFKVKLNAVQEKELPALDDEFAKDVSEFDTLADLKKDVKDRLQKDADNKAQVDMENGLIATVIENMEGEIPQCMFENKINEMVNDFSYRLQSQGMNLDLYLHYTGSTMEAFRATFQESAERQVKIRLALEKIAEVENLTATPEDIEAEYEKIAKNYGLEAQKVKGLLPEKEIAKDVTVNKAIDLVRDSAVVTEKKVKKTAAKSKKKAESEAEEAADEE